MPTDKAGRFHLNTQQAMASDKMAGSQPAPAAKPIGPQAPQAPEQLGPEGPAAGEVKITPNGDGTYMVELDGQAEVMGSLEEALEWVRQQSGSGDDPMAAMAGGEIAPPNLSGM